MAGRKSKLDRHRASIEKMVLEGCTNEAISERFNIKLGYVPDVLARWGIKRDRTAPPRTEGTERERFTPCPTMYAAGYEGQPYTARPRGRRGPSGD